MNLHKLYLSIFAVAAILLAVAGFAWRDHVRDEARSDAILETQKSDIANLEQHISAARAEVQSQIAAFERERQSIAVNPSRAPEVIRELIPMRSSIQPPANDMTTAKSPPDAPVPQSGITNEQAVDLAQYALTCKECSLERDQLQQEVKDQQEIVSRQKVEIDAVRRSAKGGSVWQRTVRIAKWGAIFGGLGYVMGRAQR